MKPKPYQIALGACGIFAAIAFGIGITEDNYENHEPKTVAVQEEEKSSPPQEKETGSLFSPEEYRDFLQGYVDGQVTYNEENKAFIIFDNDPKLAEEIAATSIGLISPDSWNGFVDSLVKVSSKTAENMGEKGYSIWFANPANENLYLVVVTDGVLVFDEVTGYNAVEDM